MPKVSCRFYEKICRNLICTHELIDIYHIEKLLRLRNGKLKKIVSRRDIDENNNQLYRSELVWYTSRALVSSKFVLVAWINKYAEFNLHSRAAYWNLPYWKIVRENNIDISTNNIAQYFVTCIWLPHVDIISTSWELVIIKKFNWVPGIKFGELKIR